MGSASGPKQVYQHYCQPSSASPPCFPSTQPSLVTSQPHLTHDSWRILIALTHQASGKVSTKPQSQLLSLFRKSPVFGFLQRAWKAAAWRAYVRESCSGARACVQRACCERKTGFGAGCGETEAAPCLSEFARIGMCHQELVIVVLPIKSLHISCAQCPCLNDPLFFLNSLNCQKTGSFHFICSDPFDQLWLLIFLTNADDLLHILTHDGLIVTVTPSLSLSLSLSRPAQPGPQLHRLPDPAAGPGPSRGWWPHGELRPSCDPDSAESELVDTRLEWADTVTTARGSEHSAPKNSLFKY